jgi:hypothetical protein
MEEFQFIDGLAHAIRMENQEQVFCGCATFARLSVRVPELGKSVVGGRLTGLCTKSGSAQEIMYSCAKAA